LRPLARTVSTAVGLDGGIARARRDPAGKQTSNLFEVIAGKSILEFRRDDPEDAPPSSKCFALVQGVDPKPKRRLLSKRFVKKQQRPWTDRGAHLLLQMRIRVLKEELDALFRAWSPASAQRPNASRQRSPRIFMLSR
jgi:hypothetical protein